MGESERYKYYLVDPDVFESTTSGRQHPQEDDVGDEYEEEEEKEKNDDEKDEDEDEDRELTELVKLRQVNSAMVELN